jgi:two-component system OmpR family sensor kinase
VSLRLRLIGASVLVALLALAGAGFATYTAYARSQLQQIDQTLQRTHEPVEQLVAAGGAELEHQIERLVPGTFVAVRRPDGVVELSIPAREPGHDALTADISGLATSAGTDSIADIPTFATVDATSGSDRLRVRVSRLADGRILVIGESLHEAREARERLIAIEVVVATAALLVAGLVAWLLVVLGLRPLDRVEHTAQLIADQGDLEQEVPGADRSDEVGRLAKVLNTMLGRIRAAFDQRDETEEALRRSEERMRRFVADVSHELRTPITAVRAYAELFERGARDRPDDLARAMRGIALETGRMHELVEELLLLAELDEGRPLAIADVDLSEVVVDAISAARAVSADWPVSLRVADVVVVRGDAARLRQVVDNLLSNVRAHTPAGTRTSIEIAARGGRAVLTVADDGPGMPPEQAQRMFERFFRADASRSRTSGGSGLGMAIVHALVTAHHGTVEVATAPGRGLSITISLPLVRGVSDDDARSEDDG